MPGGGKAIASHAAVVLCLVCGLTARSQANDDTASRNPAIVNDLSHRHSCRHRRIHNDGPHQVTNVSCLSTCERKAHTVPCELIDKLLGARDDRLDHLPWDQVLVSSDCARQQNVVCCPNAQEVIKIHDDRILRNALPNAEVASLLPVHVRQRRLCASSISMHDNRLAWIIGQDIWHNLAKGLGEQAFVHVFDGCMDIALVC
mmetsp:Transcript_36896/g.86483  ORF Transcript_36896/g.86483 Transcript_36896/m.86483 type:complete len:202 (-) Transcript_36896:898-1503(-)